ncbi:MAG: hypothetical protein ABUS51_07905 [Acidobacteriota bacterium]
MMGSSLKIAVALPVLCCAALAQSVLTGNYDNARTNSNLSETLLNPSSVKTGSFGKLFSLSVDGQIYAQPLYQRNVTISGGGTHNVIFVATMHNSVYAFDADVPAVPLWSVNLGPAVPAGNYLSDTGPYTDIVPENGILGTPVIDAATGTLYVVAATFESGSYIYRLHALDTGSGAERFNAPAAIAAQVVGIGAGSSDASLPFDASQHIQRPALLLANGVVYISFGSHGDAPPFHGWILGYSAYDVRSQVSVFNPTPNGDGGAFWQSGRGPALDADGNIYAVSSNGDTDETSNFSDNVLKLDPKNLAVTDWFAPFNVQFLNDNDDDLGACGAILIEGTNYLITGGKQGVFYLLDRTNFGHMGANDSQILQSVDTGHFGIFNMALWNRPDGPLVYLHTANSAVTSYKLQGGQFTTTPFARSVNGFNVPFQGMAISANGGTPGSGVLWVLAPASYPLPSRAVLHAYNAEDLSEIWNSDMTGGDSPGNFVKFTNPTVANGKVYAATASNQLVVYGAGDAVASPAPVITGIVNAASYADGPLAAGEIVAVFGSNLGPVDLQAGAFDSNGIMGSQLGATQVTFNGVPGPIVYTSAGAIAAIVPYEVSGADTVAVQVVFNSQPSSPVTLPVAAAAPGIFTANASGSGPGAILNADYSLNSPDNPAPAGGIVIVYATGGGPTNPPAATGAITTAATALASDVQVTAGGQPANVLYAGNAGGEVAGAVQLNLQLPGDVTGTVPIVVSVAGVASQATATVSIR